ncbi:hypothetical protein GPECTOR_1g269 [Gonium pectorale]|uniref:Kinesin motor domain-containing protein n=1 Tax=Gonium pectorale TaxID=33097 RepID=A0A150H2P4_GONPE|nr:hypothetical protein GPECTOR_1g269 [Gonium pectorale]|eukprot:KXZ56305.1 hypothetical protein GPECTOR_1g269 [Gonium pectorale]
MGLGREQLLALSGGDEDAAADSVIPYALRQLFQNMEAARGRRVFTMHISFVEVYMEKYYDLLSQRAPVSAKTSCEGEVLLVGAQLRRVTCMEEVVRLLQVGGHARMTKGTSQNDRSSRSHAVLTVHVQSRAATQPASQAAAAVPAPASPAPASIGTGPPSVESPGGTSPATPAHGTPSPARACAAVVEGDASAAAAFRAAPPLRSCLHLVDLAGSESVGRAGTVGLAAKEGNNINLSLMTLRNLIQLLAAPKAPGAPPKVLPYRDSKLTTLLRDALGGNSSTLFVACVSPADACAATTVSTLEFATTARRIRTKPAVNIGGADSAEVLELHRIIHKYERQRVARRDGGRCEALSCSGSGGCDDAKRREGRSVSGISSRASGLIAASPASTLAGSGDGSSGLADPWQGAGALADRVVLLEAENEQLRQQVAYLSALAGDLRAQVEEAASAAARPPHPETPTSSRRCPAAGSIFLEPEPLLGLQSGKEANGGPAALLAWVTDRVSEEEAQLATHEARLRQLLVEQGLLTAGFGPAQSLPAHDTLVRYAAEQVAALEAGLAEAAGEQDPRLEELLRIRLDSMRELQQGLRRAADLEAAVAMHRELQVLVSAYAGLHGARPAGVPATAASAALERELQALRRQRRNQVIKDAAVAREKLRELEGLLGPPTPLQCGVLHPQPSSGSGGSSNASGSSCTLSAAASASLTLSRQTSLAPSLGGTSASGVQSPHRVGAAYPGLAWAEGLEDGGEELCPGAEESPEACSRSQGTPSVFAQLLPQLQLSQVGPWLDALLDYETRVQQYGRVLKGALQERESVYAELQEVERELAQAMRGDPAGAPQRSAGAYSGGGSGPVGGGVDGGTSGWVAGAGSCPQRHLDVMATRQARLQKRLEELCAEVASLQIAVVDAREEVEQARGSAAGGAVSSALARGDWWSCVPSLELARPALRLLLERAARYRGAFLEAVERGDALEHQVSELEVQCQQADAQLAAYALELSAARAAASAGGERVFRATAVAG